MNNTLSKQDVVKLIESVKFLSNLEIGGMKFHCYKNGEECVTVKDANGKEVKIKFGDIKIASEQNTGSQTLSATLPSQLRGLDGIESDISTLNGLSEINDRQKGGNMYSDSSEVHRTFIKSSKSQKKNKVKQDFSSTSTLMIGGNYENSETSSVNPGFMMGGGEVNTDIYSATSILKELPPKEVNSQANQTKEVVQLKEQVMQVKEVQKQQGGALFSDTSSYNPTSRKLKNAIFSENSTMNASRQSDTSSFNPNLFKNKQFSETSDGIGQMGGACPCSQTSSIEPGMFGGSKDFSETSSVNPKMIGKMIGNIMGGGESDTLASISEIKERKNKKSNLDLNIFKTQAGGASSEIKQKLRSMGIHSSSTDSLCE